MGNSRNCAYCRKNGYCVLHREICSCSGNCQACSDRLRPVSESHHRHVENWWRRELKDLSSRTKLFEFRTRHVNGYAVFRTCRRKRRFRSTSEAMARAREAFQREGVVLAVYECPFCGGFHLTKQLRSHLPRVKVRREYLIQIEEVA